MDVAIVPPRANFHIDCSRFSTWDAVGDDPERPPRESGRIDAEDRHEKRRWKAEFESSSNLLRESEAIREALWKQRTVDPLFKVREMANQVDFDRLTAAVIDLLQFLRHRATEDEELAIRLNALGAALISKDVDPEADVEIESGVREPERVDAGTEDRRHPPSADRPKSKRKWVPVSGLTLGQSSPNRAPTVEFPESAIPSQSDLDIPLLEKRLRIKAEGARWAASRRRQLANGRDYATDIEPLDRDIIERARKIPGCFLWMCNSSGPEPDNLNLFDLCGDCYEVAADAVELTRQIVDEGRFCDELLEPAMELAAEAQSALRSVLKTIDAPADHDQLTIFNWLRELGTTHQVQINRHMRTSDPADPTQHQALADRIEQLSGEFDKSVAAARLRRKRIGKVRHKCSVIASEQETPDSEWMILARTVQELIDDGMPPSNRELRELILPVHDLLPGDLDWPTGFRLVLAEVDRYLSLNPQVEEVSNASYSPEVAQVRSLVEGKSIFLIGGQRRRFSAEAIQRAFGLRELVWISTDEHAPLSTFEPSIARDDVVVVLLAIRWSSHSYGDVRQFCERYGKPLVRLPRGYNANQIAFEIMGQCSERLAQQLV